ncbi:MAG TPA: bifunctional phosphopantothenoylcysteine decarboxylase/phosphopantothenate--cysteine ligase CoaBC [Desulfobulbaceae bacterium]|nr:bifunctional phosphopantothenoylcysteine decarboxylase/phosphopantothenate--cysteine ligase CoaBC [Desulfobulbaceae bacterium]
MAQSVFAGKRIVIGVCGSIAAFKVAGWVSELAKEEALVSVVMTSSAREFIMPLTFAALSGNDVHSGMFGTGNEDVMAHINIGRDADVILVAPATANLMARLAIGMADDLLTTTLLASRAGVLICPAMNPRMYDHPATRRNLRTLKELGYVIIDPESGMMACKEEGEGRLAEWDTVREYLAKSLSAQDLQGQRVLVTAGPTREPLDPARFLSNRSSGKMGYALARAAFRRGAEVILVSGPTALPCPPGVTRETVQTALEMRERVLAHAEGCSVIVKAAAVADYRPETLHEHKVKKENIEKELVLEKNPDILFELGKQKKSGQVLVGFAAESKNLAEEGLKKLRKKNLDLIAVNDIGGDRTGFESETNQLLLITRSGTETLPFTSKAHTADLLWDRIVALL